MKIPHVYLAVGLSLLALSRACAAVAVTNFAQPFSTTVVVGKPDNSDFQTAIGFTTGPSIVELNSIAIVGFTFGGPSLSGLAVAIYRGVDVNGPTGLVSQLVGSVIPSGAQAAIYSYQP